MKHFLSIFLLIIMVTSLSVSAVEQLKDGDIYELKECKTDDADEKSKVEKEKEVYNFESNSLLQIDDFSLAKLKKQIVIKNDNLKSERHTFLPELPPEV